MLSGRPSHMQELRILSLCLILKATKTFISDLNLKSNCKLCKKRFFKTQILHPEMKATFAIAALFGFEYVQLLRDRMFTGIIYEQN